MLTKKEIRTEIRARRRALSQQDWMEKSHCICEKICALSEYREAQLIYAYLAKSGEVLLDELILDALRQGKQVAVPKVLGPEMVFYELTDLADVEIGCMGIREPLLRREVSASKENGKALMLLPAVAVDGQCHRVGYGGGYYDKYLATHPETVKLAAVFSFQLYDQVPVESFDVPLDGIVTETMVLRRQSL